MAIAPKDAMLLNTEEQNEVKKLENIIDRILQQRFSGHSCEIEIGKDDLYISDRLLMGLKEAYAKAGWIISKEERSEERCVGTSGYTDSPVYETCRFNVLVFQIKKSEI